jgi:pyruvate dehydrogenase E2 component (dihydrolipoamide acetyltransferase)
MAKLLEMPKLSPTMEEGVLSAWHKNEGDAIEVDDLLAEVETDKATMEFRAFDKGTLLKILVSPGANVKLGDPVAIVGNAGDDVTALVAKASAGAAAGAGAVDAAAAAAANASAAAEGRGPDTQLTGGGAAAKPAEGPTAPTLVPPMQTTARSPERQPATPSGSVLTRTERAPFAAAGGGGSGGGGGLGVVASDETNGTGRVLASPFVRKTARDRGLDLAGAHGSGPRGRVLPADLDQIAGSAKRAADTAATSSALARSTPTAPGNDGAIAPGNGLSAPEIRPLSPMRKTIARRLSESKRTVPHFYLTIDVDAGKLVELREQINKELALDAGDGKRSEEAKPFKVSVNDLLLKAVAGALARVPECNAQFTEEAILVHTRIDVSVEVAVPEGLVTPVVRNADRKSVVAIAREVRELATRARAKKLKPEEMSNGTFSVSNLGMFGIDEFSAVINPPEGAILAIGQVREAPVVQNGAIVVGKRISMTLSCDHRVIDGAVGASFLAELRALVERPMRVLTG